MTVPGIAAVARRAPPWALAASTVAAVAFLALALLVVIGATRGVDLAVIRAFQSVASDRLDLIANAHTLLGQLVVTLSVAAILAVVVWRRLGGYAWAGPALILATGAIELAFKLLIAHPSPPAEFVRASHNVLGIKGPAAAFPSGHVARITFLAFVLVALVPGRLSALVAATVVVATVFLRVYIGDHWVSDTLGGAALGAGIGALAVAWMRATARD